MGIFYDHVVEYLVVQAGGRATIVAPGFATNERVRKSAWFAERAPSWRRLSHMKHRRILDKSFDVELSDNERSKLNMLLSELPDITEHGWFEGVYVSDTYGCDLPHSLVNR